MQGEEAELCRRLEVQVRALREEVWKLELHHRLISRRVTVDLALWNVVAEYFRLFQYALMAYVPEEERCKDPLSGCLYEARVHQDFLQATMVPSVIIDDDKGVATMLERWRFVSISQPNFEMEVAHLENGPSDTIIATTKIRIVMYDSSVRHAFPNLANSDRGKYLSMKLLRQRFEINGSTIFIWAVKEGVC